MRSNVSFTTLSVAIAVCFALGGCGSPQDEAAVSEPEQMEAVDDRLQQAEPDEGDLQAVDAPESEGPSPEELRAALGIVEDFRPSLAHGPKGPEHQKYIVLHDTEGNGSASSVVDWWDSNGNLIAAHFVINKDGSIVQCVPIDSIAHHAGFGDTGHNAAYGVPEDGRDDKLETKPKGPNIADYGMNSYSVGIEMVHVGGSGDYPEAQLEALDALVEYIDAYYGFESEIIDHKAWRTGNSDTSKEFATYFENYKSTRTHDGVARSN